MGEPTFEQQASRELADAVFSDPALRDRFESMVKDTNGRELARDDFSWIPQEAREGHRPPSEFSRFKSLAQKLFSVTKGEAERVHRGHS